MDAAINIAKLTRSVISADLPHSFLDVNRWRVWLRSDPEFPVSTGTAFQIIAEVDPIARSFILTNGVPPGAAERAPCGHPVLEQKSPLAAGTAKVALFAVEPGAGLAWRVLRMRWMPSFFRPVVLSQA
jgi:hypothetical protein